MSDDEIWGELPDLHTIDDEVDDGLPLVDEPTDDSEPARDQPRKTRARRRRVWFSS